MLITIGNSLPPFDHVLIVFGNSTGLEKTNLKNMRPRKYNHDENVTKYNIIRLFVGSVHVIRVGCVV